jgi:hypothetical protein
MIGNLLTLFTALATVGVGLATFESLLARRVPVRIRRARDIESPPGNPVEGF